MLPDRNPTVRKYPRTLQEAFPNSIEIAQWMEHHRAPMTGRDVVWYTGLFMLVTTTTAAVMWMI